MFWISIIALLSGALLPLAFSPFDIYSLAFILPAILLFIWKNKSPTQTLWTGWLFGLGFFGTGASWVAISMYRFGNASIPLTILITFLFISFLALFPAMLGYVFGKFSKKLSEPKKCLLLFPALWVVWECARSVLFTGFPWLLLGYTQLTTPLKGLSPLIGVYGLSLIVTVFSGTLVLLATSQEKKIKIISFVLILGLTGLGWIFKNHAWTKPIGLPIKTSLIQGNIPQEIKWDASYILRTIAVYKNLTLSHLSSTLIVWPEGAMPIYANNANNFIQKLGKIAKNHHSNIIFGVPIQDNQNQEKYYNGLLLIGDNQGQYLKRHLVPFGEYTPLVSIFKKAMSYFNIPMSAFSAGPKNQTALIVNHIRIAPFICYEIAFPNQVLNAAENSELLMTLSDDSWFGKSIALSQHMQMAQMRSLETGRYQVLSTNTGITVFISPFGKIIKGAPIDQQTVITDNVQPMTGKTPLMMWHYYPVMGIIVLMFLVILFL